MNTTTNSQTGQVRREIRSGNRIIVQVSQADGTWWNIRTFDARTGK
jgi:hypothetical protein